MELVPAAVAERLIALSRREGLWRGVLLGFGCGLMGGIVAAIAVVRGVVG